MSTSIEDRVNFLEKIVLSQQQIIHHQMLHPGADVPVTSAIPGLLGRGRGGAAQRQPVLDTLEIATPLGSPNSPPTGLASAVMGASRTQVAELRQQLARANEEKEKVLGELQSVKARTQRDVDEKLRAALSRCDKLSRDVTRAEAEKRDLQNRLDSLANDHAEEIAAYKALVQYEHCHHAKQIGDLMLLHKNEVERHAAAQAKSTSAAQQRLSSPRKFTDTAVDASSMKRELEKRENAEEPPRKKFQPEPARKTSVRPVPPRLSGTARARTKSDSAAAATNTQPLMGHMLGSSSVRGPQLIEPPILAPADLVGPTAATARAVPLGSRSAISSSKGGSPAPVNPLRGPDITRCFAFSGIPLETKQQLIEKINQLGHDASVIECGDAPPPDSVTHVVVMLTPRSVKSLSALVAGKWIVNPNYIDDSAVNGFWLDEQNYGCLRCWPLPLQGRCVKVQLADNEIRRKLEEVVRYGDGIVISPTATQVVDNALIFTSGDDLLEFCYHSSSSAE